MVRDEKGWGSFDFPSVIIHCVRFPIYISGRFISFDRWSIFSGGPKNGIRYINMYTVLICESSWSRKEVLRVLWSRSTFRPLMYASDDV